MTAQKPECKVWEDDLVADCGGVWTSDDDPFEVCEINPGFDKRGYARLFAASPAMARLLLAALERSIQGERNCPSCNRIHDKFDRSEYGFFHECELAKVLRAAGALT